MGKRFNGGNSMNKHTKKYLEFKDTQQKIMDVFLDENAFFAFTQEQLQEGVENWKVGLEDVSRIGTCAFILKSQLEEFYSIVETLSENQDRFLECEDNFLAAMLYEFENFGLEYNGIQYVLEYAFGLTTKALTRTQRVWFNEAIDMYRGVLEVNKFNDLTHEDKEEYLEIYFSNNPGQRELVEHMIKSQGCSEYEALKWSYHCTVEEIGEKIGLEYGDVIGFCEALLSFDELCNIDYSSLECEMKKQKSGV